MRILMIAPQPFFQPRGTPFSEFYRVRAMTELGHEVDMVTYPIGEDVSIGGLRIYRSLGIPGVRSIRIGPSFTKLALDVLVFFSSLRRLVARRYDLLDCHEEAGLMGVLLSKLFRVPLLYDMHSSLPEQLSNFDYPGARLLRGLFDVAEKVTIRGSAAIIVICPHLKDVVARVDAAKPTFVIENSPLAETGEEIPAKETMRIRSELGLESAFVLLYTGTFEAYQGLSLLYEAFGRASEEEPSARLLMVGGTVPQVEEAKRDVARFGLEGKVVFTGQRPPSEMPRYLSVGDVLVSPRSRGTNTPLKIYSYLHSGKPIVATRLLTHTQVLDDECAVLTEPDPEDFARGILALARDPERRHRLGASARRLSEESYSYERYLERTKRALDIVSDGMARPLGSERPITTANANANANAHQDTIP
jgi:glycosyltransferase involved in cell wall biosynthesis